MRRERERVVRVGVQRESAARTVLTAARKQSKRLGASNVERDVTVRNPVFQSNLGHEYVGAHPKATSDSV